MDFSTRSVVIERSGVLKLYAQDDGAAASQSALLERSISLQLPHQFAMRRSVFHAMVAIGALSIAFARSAAAHPMPKSLVLLDLGAGGVHAELRLPLDRLEIGFGQPLLTDANTRVDQLRENLRRYVAAHISATSPDGKLWRTTVGDLTLADEKPAHMLVVEVNIDAPPGESPRVFTPRRRQALHQASMVLSRKHSR